MVQIDDEGTIDGENLNAMYPEHLKELGRKVINTCLPSTGNSDIRFPQYNNNSLFFIYR